MKKPGPKPKSPEKRYWTYVDKNGPWCKELGSNCWEWTCAKDNDGYGKFWLEDGRTMYAHRYSFFLKEGYIPDYSKGLLVRHLCHNTGCQNPAHLQVGTHKDNAGDMVKAGRSLNQSGEKNHAAKLTQQEVNELHLLWETGKYTQKQLGEKYGISHKHINRIVTGKRWKIKNGVQKLC